MPDDQHDLCHEHRSEFRQRPSGRHCEMQNANAARIAERAPRLWSDSSR